MGVFWYHFPRIVVKTEPMNMNLIYSKSYPFAEIIDFKLELRVIHSPVWY